jgi:uncharacterized membrane protein
MKFRSSILIIGAISFIILVISLSLLLANRFNVTTCGCPKVISQNFVYLFILLSVIFVSSLLYYLFSLKLDYKDKTIEKNIEILYSILDKEEKNVLQKIIKNKGQISQSQISEDYGKLKAHRIIQKLKEKKIIEVQENGKTNKILLKKELMGELK